MDLYPWRTTAREGAATTWGASHAVAALAAEAVTLLAHWPDPDPLPWWRPIAAADQARDLPALQQAVGNLRQHVTTHGVA